MRHLTQERAAESLHRRLEGLRSLVTVSFREGESLLRVAVRRAPPRGAVPRSFRGYRVEVVLVGGGK